MSTKNKVLLLHVLHENGNINLLRHHNITFREIAELVNENIESGFLINNEGIIALTDKGIEFLKTNIRLIKERDKSKWIDLDMKNKIMKIDKNEVFLPTRDRFSFLK